MPKTNLYSVTVPPMRKMLEALSKMLDKATAHTNTKATERRPGSYYAEALLNDRLVFDQFPLKMQVQMACDNAKGGAARLAGIEPPKFEDNENSIAELQKRIEKTLAFVATIKPEQIVAREEERVTLSYFPGKYLTAFDYATEYLIPNFYFHVVTAYSIMRKNGIDLGKADYMGGVPLKDL